MDTISKLKILTAGAKVDVSCPSVCSLKLLMTNVCIYDCAYCAHRRSNDIPRAVFAPEEIAALTMLYYRRKLVSGLFLSSGIIKSPDYTMELMIKALRILRVEHRFRGYIHAKVMPGADRELLTQLGRLADRMSINIELPTEESLIHIAPDKNRKAILSPMGYVSSAISQSGEKNFAPAGQCTQLIVGATPENDRTIVNLAQGLYGKYGLRRVFYSAYEPVNGRDRDKKLPVDDPPLLRQHRLYQADFLLRSYGFCADELFNPSRENLSLNLDPKCRWALENMQIFPVEVNRADLFEILRVPGIGQISAKRIVSARRLGSLDFDSLKKMGVSLARAKYFITCNGKMHNRAALLNGHVEFLERKLSDNEWEQQMLIPH